jgi:hypothetical protein
MTSRGVFVLHVVLTIMHHQQAITSTTITAAHLNEAHPCSYNPWMNLLLDLPPIETIIIVLLEDTILENLKPCILIMVMAAYTQ